MAHFIAIARGRATGEATRLGNQNSGASATVNGWDSGVTVRALVDDDGNDMFRVFVTGGSNGSSEQLIATVRNGRIAFDNNAAGVTA